MVYTYSAENRLMEPCSYMYTPFEGKAFLKSYLNSRKACRDELEAMVFGSRVTDDFGTKILALGIKELTSYLKTVEPSIRRRLEPLYPAPVRQEQKGRLKGSDYTPRTRWDGEPHSLEDMKRGETIKTLYLIRNLLVALASGSDQMMREAKKWIDRLVQKFEVTKKIFTAYPSISRKGFGAYDDLTVYALLALLLALYYGRTGNLKYLNTLIKLDDLLCSVKDTVKKDLVAYIACYLSLLFEDTYVRELMWRKGLQRCILMT